MSVVVQQNRHTDSWTVHCCQWQMLMNQPFASWSDFSRDRIKNKSRCECEQQLIHIHICTSRTSLSVFRKLSRTEGTVGLQQQTFLQNSKSSSTCARIFFLTLGLIFLHNLAELLKHRFVALASVFWMCGLHCTPIHRPSIQLCSCLSCRTDTVFADVTAV